MTQTIAWSVIFFIASAAASSAYLTVSEIFPLDRVRYLPFVCKTSFRGVSLLYWKGETAENVNKLIALSWDFKDGSRSVDSRLYAE